MDLGICVSIFIRKIEKIHCFYENNVDYFNEIALAMPSIRLTQQAFSTFIAVHFWFQKNS